MRTRWIFALALAAGCAHQQPLPGSFAQDALIRSDSACHTFDVAQPPVLKYTCFVHSAQSDGADASTRAGREEIVARKLSSVCAGVEIERDEIFRTDELGGTTWRIQARCIRA